jgi:HTH-type transcriptional regulator/antitoxin HigA
MQADHNYQIQMENGLHPTHYESRRIRREGVARNMIAIPDKYALEVGSPTPITTGRQHEEYLSVLDKLASKDDPTSEEEKYAEVLMTLIEAYEEEHHSIPDASPVEVLRTLMDANDLRQKDLAPIFGSESIVSEILHKKRELNKAHIEKLSKRFNISPAVFF